MPTVCELKIELKQKGIKGITGLNKSGLESLLKGGKSAEPNKPKPFVPAPTKGESPKVAEKQIDKKIKPPKPPKILMLTNKQVKEKKEPKPKKLTKQMKFYEDHKQRIDSFMKSPKPVLTGKLNKIESLMKNAGTDAEKKQAQMQYEIIMAAIMMKKK
jgi:hypothetical protein